MGAKHWGAFENTTRHQSEPLVAQVPLEIRPYRAHSPKYQFQK